MNSENEKSLSEKISDDIITYILKEGLHPGDRLPNELILSKSMGVGRSSLREAMKLLASRNIVDIRQGSGTYVSEDPGMAKDPLGLTFIEDRQKLAYDLLEVRFLLEPSIAASAAQHADAEDIKKLQTICSEIEALLCNNQDYTEKDIEFHTAIAMSSKNLVVPRLVPIINSSIELFIDLTNRSLLQETLETHRGILDAIAAHDPIAAQDAMYLHLVYNRRLILKKAGQKTGAIPSQPSAFS